jgi:hypothetical protein
VTHDHDHDDGCAGGNGKAAGGGFGGFLRSLLSGLPWHERAEANETLRFASPSGGAIRVDNVNGCTVVSGEDRSDVEIVAHKAARAGSEEEAMRLAGAIRVLAREDAAGMLEVEVELPGRWTHRGRADLEIHAPRSVRVQVTASNGRVCLSGMRAAVSLKSSNGPVRVDDVVGDVDVHTSNARVHTHGTRGKLVARSSNGKIDLEEHRGSVDAATSNGTIHCDVEDVGKEGVVLVTSNGRISLELPDQVDGDVDIRVDNGLIRALRETCGAATCACTRLHHSARERAGRLKGTLGRGGVPIRLRASNGTISLR